MKPLMRDLLRFSAIFFIAWPLRATDAVTGSTPDRIGIYDSRAVAYAHFCSPVFQKHLKEMIARAKTAQEAGDAKAPQYADELKAMQAAIHREVFSTAPASEAMTAIKDRIADIEKQAGVSVLISKWDAPALQQHQGAAKTDVTDRLVHEFIQPNDQQKRTVQSLESATPIPLEKCDQLIKDGKI